MFLIFCSFSTIMLDKVLIGAVKYNENNIEMLGSFHNLFKN